MKPHPRIRKTIKWGGAVVTVLLVGVWFGSGWWAISYSASSWGLALWPGAVAAGVSRDPYLAVQSGWEINPQPQNEPWKLWFALEWIGPEKGVIVPLWTILAATALPTAAAWRLDALARRRERTHLCPKCNYDRTGLAAGAKCPECGSLPS